MKKNNYYSKRDQMKEERRSQLADQTNTTCHTANSNNFFCKDHDKQELSVFYGVTKDMMCL